MVSCTIHKDRPSDGRKSFAVMLLQIPDLPRGVESIENLKLQAVIGCTEGKDGRFGWVDLSPDEKQMIGDALNQHGAIPLVWYWCELD